jgi:hypothetical protein
MIGAMGGGRRAVAPPIRKAAAVAQLCGSLSVATITTQDAVDHSTNQGSVTITRASAVAIARAIAKTVAGAAVVDRSTALATPVSGNMTASVSGNMTVAGVASHRVSAAAMTTGSR